MSEWNIGGVQLRHNEDGTFFVYQPAANRLLSPELAAKVAYIILEAVGDDIAEAAAVPQWTAHFDPAQPEAGLIYVQSTVGGGVISTSAGPATPTDDEFADAIKGLARVEAALTDTEQQADKNAELSRAQPVKRGPGRPRKARP